MAKLYFKYGIVNSSKSISILKTLQHCEERGMSVYIMKSSMDTRDYNVIKSRALGIERPVDMLLNPASDVLKILNYEIKDIDVVIIDECQFLTVRQVDDVREFVDTVDKPVICYGLKSDYRGYMYDGSKRLFEVADLVEEFETVCSCGSKAVFRNKLSLEEVMDINIKLRDDGIYEPLCSRCYRKRVNRSDSDVSSEVCKSFIENKSYLTDLVKKLDRTPQSARDSLLNEVICADYYISRLLSSDKDNLLSDELYGIKRCFESVLRTATPQELLFASKK